jgi:hypothetical protein
LYFKPYISPIFNEYNYYASDDDILNYYSKKCDGKIYETSFGLYNKMGLTKQVPSTTYISLDNPPKDFNDRGLYFKKSKLPISKEKNDIYLLQILDCIEGVVSYNIPAQLPNEAVEILIKRHFQKYLSDMDLLKITEYSLSYNAKTKAVTACILDNLHYKKLAKEIRQTYSLSTKIKLNISEKILKNQSKYGIA